MSRYLKCDICSIIVISDKIVKYTSIVNTSHSNTPNMLYKLCSTSKSPSTTTTMFSNELLPTKCTKSVRNISMLHNLDQMVVKLEARIARIKNMVSNSSVVSNLQSTNTTKTKKCQPETGDRPDLIQTEPVPNMSHGQHTLPVTAQSRSWLHGHGQHTPRVTAQVRSQPSVHTPHTPRVTVGVPDSHSLRLARKQHKNKLNEKVKNKKTNQRSHVKTNDLSDSLPVANKLSVSRTPLSQELNSPVSLPVANKKTEDRHPVLIVQLCAETTRFGLCRRALHVLISVRAKINKN